MVTELDCWACSETSLESNTATPKHLIWGSKSTSPSIMFKTLKLSHFYGQYCVEKLFAYFMPPLFTLYLLA